MPAERRSCEWCKWLSQPRKYVMPYCLHWVYALPDAEPHELRDGCWTPREGESDG